MESNDNIQELRKKIQRRMLVHQIFCIAFSIFLLYWLWSLITDFNSQTITHNIIYGLLFLSVSDSHWTRCKLLGTAKEELQSDDTTVLEECYKRMNSACKRDIISVVGTAFLVILIMVSLYFWTISNYEIRG